MLHRMRNVLVCLFWFLCTVHGAQASTPIAPGDRVLVVGDGLAAELGARGILESIVGGDATFRHLGATGTEAIALPGPDDVDGESPDVVIACVGMVDAIRGDSHLPRFRQALVEFTEAWPGRRVILVTPIPPEPSDADGSMAHALAVARFAHAIHDESGRMDSRSIDLHGPLTIARRTGSVDTTYDGMHLSNAGWNYVRDELAWQLGYADRDPAMELTSTDGVTAMTDQSGELELLADPEGLPVLASTQPTVSPESAGPTWEETLERIRSADGSDIEGLRSDMARLVSDADRADAAMEAIRPFAMEDRSEAVRLAALAALDELPDGRRPESGIRTIRMEAVPVKMVYDVTRFDAVAGEPVRIVLDNPDAQPHNLLVLKPGSLRSIGRQVDAMENDAEAKARHWVPDSPKVLHVMAMVQPGDRGELRFIAPTRPGRYPFVCTYPGHWRMMNGVMTVRAKD